MNESHQQQANQLLTALELSLPPIAVALCNVVPNDVAALDSMVPAGCAFWQKAATHTFVTSAKDHEMCSIGIHTHNMSEAPASQPDERPTVQESLQRLSSSFQGNSTGGA